MTQIIRATTGSRPETMGSYSRLIAIDNLIFVSNTGGRNPHTGQIPPDLDEQTNQVLDNIDNALRAVDASLDDVVSAKVFVQWREDIDAVMAAYATRMRAIRPTLTLTCPPLGTDHLRVEIEVIAWRGAGAMPITDITITP